MNKIYIFVLVVASVLLTACSNSSSASTEDALVKKSESLFSLFETHNWVGISDMTHPDGLVFSLFADIGSPSSNEVIISKEKLSEENQEKITWGPLTGVQVFKTKDDYVDEYLFKSIYGDDLKYDTVNFNSSSVKSGGVINTIPTYFPDAEYVEYYSQASDKEYDWQALRFVFKEHKGEWLLFAIVRDVHNP